MDGRLIGLTGLDGVQGRVEGRIAVRGDRGLDSFVDRRAVAAPIPRLTQVMRTTLLLKRRGMAGASAGAPALIAR